MFPLLIKLIICNAIRDSYEEDHITLQVIISIYKFVSETYQTYVFVSE